MIETYFMNKETGELLTYEEMIQQGIEEYDLFDETNCMNWEDYYCELHWNSSKRIYEEK